MSFNTADTAVFLWHGLIVVRFHPAHTHTETVKPSPAIISSQMRTRTHTELIVMHPGGRRGAQLSHCRLKTSESGDAQTPLHPPQSPSHPGRLTD